MKNHRNSHAATTAPAPAAPTPPQMPMQLPMPDPMVVIGNLTMKIATMENALNLAINELNKWGSFEMDFEQVKAIIESSKASVESSKASATEPPG